MWQSPISLFRQVLVTFISKVFVPGFKYFATSHLNGYVHNKVAFCPLTKISARLLTSPRSNSARLGKDGRYKLYK